MSLGQVGYKFFRGRVAFFSLLKVFGIGEGDFILTPGFTDIIVPLAIRYVGAIPCYVDINPETYNCSYNNYLTAYRRLADENKAGKITAVVIKHAYGNPNNDSQKIADWAKEKGLFVIEDCSQVNAISSVGKVGDIGDAAFFSSQWNYPFSIGLGGIAVMNDARYVKVMAAMEKAARKPGVGDSAWLAVQLAVHRIFWLPLFYQMVLRTQRIFAKIGFYDDAFNGQGVDEKIPQDFFKGMGHLQKKMLETFCGKYDEVNDCRRQLATEYDRLLRQRGLPVFFRESDAVLNRYPVRVKDKITCLKNARLAKVELGDWFDHPLHPAGACRDDLFWDDSLCPNAVKAAQEVIDLPLHSRISGRDLEKIVDYINDFATIG